MRLTDFGVLTFDCYGTLIDWESGMVEALRPLLGKLARQPSRNELLEAHARHESSQQITTPTKRYSELLAVVYKRLAEEWGAAASWDDYASAVTTLARAEAAPATRGWLAELITHRIAGLDLAAIARHLSGGVDGIKTTVEIAP